jgi:hypothetical protein
MNIIKHHLYVVKYAASTREASVGKTLGELPELTEEEFRIAIKDSPVKRVKWRGLMRNVGAASLEYGSYQALNTLDHTAE